ncbi:erythrocyte membrane protein 1, PfEMP1 [Plasmodium sp. gorilla clade G1]|nr:erythrocyte membrane protein 1, PfEMP1 [Plasmodium sp. gorilla clade G1]
MAPGGRQGDGGEDIDHQSAKHLLDSIGKIVHDQVKNSDAAKKYIEELKGNLTSSTFFGGETAYTDDPCTLVNDYRRNTIGTASAHGDPCGNRRGKEEVNRFSDECGGECTNNRIEGNIKARSGKDFGACAPYRRLSLCNKNLEYINNYNSSKAKHYLLAKVCYAAKHEGESIKTHYPQYEAQYPGSASSFTTCTMLARSFADIGDIVRGRDLYRGNTKEKKKRDELETNLKTIFRDIYNELTTTNGVKSRYNGDEDNNFFKLREDWWDANRGKVWEALTCDAPDDSKYFRGTCGSNAKTAIQASHKCRCKGTNSDQVPTYFDYVPQYMRWFEEWGEDFCRKKKKKVENLDTQCRGKDKDGKKRYCSRNGYDCEKTVNARGKLRMGKGCTDCFFACNPYIDWINNQKEQFDKQKNKYQNEISGNSSRRRGGGGTTKYDGYESKFYKELQNNGYGTVNDFLELLNKEDICKKAKDTKGGTIDFKEVNSGTGNSGTNDKEKGMFSHTEYCQPCPFCGMKMGSNGNFVKKSENDKCKRGNLYEPTSSAKPTEIKILKSGEGKEEIKKKLEAFCQTQNGSGDEKNSGSKELYQDWKCYKHEHVQKVKGQGEEEDEDEEDKEEVKNGGGLCILKNTYKKNAMDPDQFQKTFYDFFYYWVAHMLKDSIYWRTKKLEKCLKNEKKKCGNNKCNNDCKCFLEWVEQKKTEWGKIKDHFKMQDGFDNQGPLGVFGSDYVLEENLKLQFLNRDTEEDTEEKSENNLDAEEIKHLKQIERMMEDGETVENVDAGAEQKTIMDKLIEHEEKDAKKCLDTHNEENCKAPPKDVSRKLDPAPSPTEHDSDSDDDDEDLDEVDEDTTQDTEDQDGPATQEEVATKEEEEAPKVDGVNPCDIVKTLFSDTTKFSDACTLKYGPGGKEKFPNWKCISGDNTTTGSEAKRRVTRSTLPYGATVSEPLLPSPDAASSPSADSSNSATSAVCIPPRRRKLYIQKLHDWAIVVSPQASEAPQVPTAATSQSQSDLLTAFVESAAIETFFLWHKYKKIKEKEIAEKKKQEYGTFGLFGGASSSEMKVLDHNGLLQAQLPSGVSGGELQSPIALSAPGALVPGGPQLTGGSEGTHGVAQPQPLPQPGSNGELQPLPKVVSDEPDDPENQLANGTIPTDFLRLMFYTLGDYRDICVGNVPNGIDTVSASDQKDKEASSKLTMKQISGKIDEILKQSGEQTRDKPSKPSENPRVKWWNKHGPDIWKGMVCALTYKESDEKPTDGTNKIEKEEEVYEKFFGKPTDNNLKPVLPVPPLTTVTQNGTYKETYDYNIVTLKEDDENGGAKINELTSPPKLTDFIKRPPYFRYLEEWGENFCKERKKRLEEVKKGCREKDNGEEKYCGGDGHDCTDPILRHNDMLANLDCPGCYEQCRKYKKWIDIKFEEFHKQNDKYKGELQKLNGNSNGGGDNNCCEEIKKKTTAADFLKALKHCSNDQNSEDDKDKEYKDNKIDFNNNHQTFSRSTYCKACPIYGVKYNRGTYTAIEESEYKKKNGSVENDKDKKPTKIDVLVLGRKGEVKDNDNNLNNACKNTGILEDTCVQNWICQKKNGVHECKLNGAANTDKSFDSKYFENKISFKILFQSWIIDFIQYYNKAKERITRCTQKGENKCDSVKQRLNKKEEEWEIIKKYYNDNLKTDGEHIYSRINSFFEQQLFDSNLKKDKGNYKSLEEFEKSVGCNCHGRSKKENDKNNDVIDCLLKNLKTKAKTCQNQQKPSGENLAQCQEYTALPDEEPLEEENENQVKAPEICPKPTQPPPQPEDEDACKAAAEETVPSSEEGNPEQVPDTEPEEEATAPRPPAPPPGADKKKAEKKKPKRSLPPKYDLSEPLKNAMLSNTIMWSIGIGFAAFSYFFLKKKTKSSVGNLFQILQIPKGDYDIPTLKSSNRYIPYVSDRYKGKTYIYMEGDSSGDEKYAFMSDTTDVTSSESEYEELDINDIYVPGSPKYKTLIEVVLEPSKRDIQSDDTPSNKFSDDEWNQLKHDFISNMLQNTQNTEPNILHDNVDNNTHPTMSRHNVDQKPFIMSIHDRNLYIGQEYSYDMSTNSGENNLYSGQNNIYSGIDPTSDNRGPYSDKNDPISDSYHPYSGIDLINAALNGDYDIYDEILKRKENELFGTNHTKKNTSTNRVAKNTNSDPILNQINLFHKWLDRHRNICEERDKNKVELLDKLKKEWNKENNNNVDKTYNSDNKPSHNHVLNTDVSIQIDMDNPKTKNEFTNMDTNPDKSTMDTILDDLEKYNEPYYYDFYKDDIYYDVNDDDKTSVDHINMDHNKMDNNNSDVPTKVQIEMNVINNQELLQNEYPISHM